MSWLGKILGGGVGFIVGGPLGAVLGVTLGHIALDKGVKATFNALETRQSLYFTAVFSMLGKLAKADGRVSQYEIDTIETIMRDSLRLTPQARGFAIRIFNAAKDSPNSFEDYARQLRGVFGRSPEVLASVVELLMVVAHADDAMHPEEERLVLAAVQIFGVEQAFQRIKSRFGGVPDDVGKYYKILGCQRGDSLEVVIKKYRKLAMEYHPDRIQAKGMSPEFAEVAEEKFKEIQQAREMVEKDIAA